MDAVLLRDAIDANVFGGKAVQLGAALRAGLPVPDGIALSACFVNALVSGNNAARCAFKDIAEQMDGALAVRSSAIGEDSKDASFAGQHATKLNVHGIEPALFAVIEVWKSGRTETAVAYRERMGAGSEPQVAVVLQRLVQADIAGVLFSCHPVTGADEIIIEAGWGLGESVVQGMIIPDSYRMTRTGVVLERVAGSKDIAIRKLPNGGTWQEPVALPLARRLCLGYPQLRSLHELVTHCDKTFGVEPHDLEWAFQGSQVFLLQRRPITRIGRLSKNCALR